ncbi:MAG: helix-turn-helix domain-containing protein [Planctomycetia bacterium]
MIQPRNPAIDFENLGFSLHRSRAARMQRPHRHNEIEMTVLSRGRVKYLVGGGPAEIPAGELCVRWAAIPHQCVAADDHGEQLSLKIPLPWFLQWQLPDAFVAALMHGHLFLDREPNPEDADWVMFCRWQDLLQCNAADRERIVLLEAEARLRRMLIRVEVPSHRSEPHPGRSGDLAGWELGRFDRMIHHVAVHYVDDIGVDDVARCVSLHPRSAMRLFRDSCGMTILECLTLHRVWHAQRLLATSDMKIRQVATASGFNSAGRFYVAFRRIVGMVPGEYRKALRVR